MLASPGSSLEDALTDLGADVTVEHKLDGARIQVHRDGDVVRVWTRSLLEITDGVPEIVEQVRTLPCRTAVLDGETLALDAEGRPRSFHVEAGLAQQDSANSARTWAGATLQPTWALPTCVTVHVAAVDDARRSATAAPSSCGEVGSIVANA